MCGTTHNKAVSLQAIAVDQSAYFRSPWMPPKYLSPYPHYSSPGELSLINFAMPLLLASFNVSQGKDCRKAHVLFCLGLQNCLLPRMHLLAMIETICAAYDDLVRDDSKKTLFQEMFNLLVPLNDRQILDEKAWEEETMPFHLGWPYPGDKGILEWDVLEKCWYPMTVYIAWKNILWAQVPIPSLNISVGSWWDSWINMFFKGNGIPWHI